MFKSISTLVSTPKALTFSAALVAAVAPALVLGCGSSSGESPSGTGTVGATAVAYNRSTHALSALAGLNFLNGTYTTCIGHTDGDFWSVALRTNAGMDINPTLSVVLNNTACTLTITSLDADQSYTTAGLGVTGGFLSTPSQFATSGAPGTLAFYGNAEMTVDAMTPGAFSGVFTISFVYSDNPNSTVGIAGSTFAQVSSSAQSSQVVAPNYTNNVTGVVITTDAANKIHTVNGSVTFPSPTMGAVAGQDYVISHGPLADSTFTTADTAFNAAATMTTPFTVGDPTSITADTFVIVGQDLTNSDVWTVIFRNTANNVVAYEAVRLTFNAPTP